MFESRTYNFYSLPHLVRPRHPRVPTHSTHWTPACETRRCAAFHQTLYALDIRACPHLLHLGHPPEKDEGVLFSPTPLYALDTRVRKHLRHLAACGEALFWKAAALFFKLTCLWFAEAQNLGLYLVSRGLRGMVSALAPSTSWTPWPTGSGASTRTPSKLWTSRR